MDWFKNAELYGCVIYNNGWDIAGSGHGHGIYTQNDTSGTIKLLDNIFLAVSVIMSELGQQGGPSIIMTFRETYYSTGVLVRKIKMVIRERTIFI